MWKCTLFQGRVDLSVMFWILWFFFIRAPLQIINNELDVSSTFLTFLRKKCGKILALYNKELAPNLDEVTWVDKTVIGKRKYHQGKRQRRGILGLVNGYQHAILCLILLPL